MMIKTMLEDWEMDDEGVDGLVFPPGVNATILRRATERSTQHKNDHLSPEDDENNEK